MRGMALLAVLRELVRLVGQVAVRERCMGLWYRASNRNGMLVWTEPRREFTIQLYLTGGCQIVVCGSIKSSW